MFLELRHLRNLSAIAQSQTLSDAAVKVHLTQSALSHQIKAMESYYGTALFLRKTRPLQLTAAGRRLIELADTVLPAVALAERDLEQIEGGQSGRLNIAIECHSCFEWLMPTIDQYRDDWPEIDVDFSLAFSFDAMTALRRGDVDLVVTSEPIEADDVVYQPLFSYQMQLAVAKKHKFAKKTFIEAHDLASETLIHYPVDRSRLDIFHKFLEPAGISPKATRQAELTIMMIQLVASQRGVAALPNWALTEYTAKSYVLAKALNKEGLWSTLYTAVRRDDAQRQYMSAFLDTARHASFMTLKGIRRVS